MESQLFQHFFPREDEESGALSPLVEPLCMVLYDMLRPAFIHLQDLDDLCELVDILQHEARLQTCNFERSANLRGEQGLYSMLALSFESAWVHNVRAAVGTAGPVHV